MNNLLNVYSYESIICLCIAHKLYQALTLEGFHQGKKGMVMKKRMVFGDRAFLHQTGWLHKNDNCRVFGSVHPIKWIQMVADTLILCLKNTQNV